MVTVRVWLIISSSDSIAKTVITGKQHESIHQHRKLPQAELTLNTNKRQTYLFNSNSFI